MPELPPSPKDGQSTDFLLGQITGQMREVIHGQNNLSQAMTGMEQNLGKRIDNTNMELRSLSTRVSALESANERREGATGILAAIAKSPVFGWVVGAIAALWALLTGKINL